MSTLFERLCHTQTLLNAWKVVKLKGSSGGIDGVSVQEFDDHIGKHLNDLQRQLLERTWNPEPYLRLNIPKNDHEKRRLGLLCIKDKIVQQAIKMLVEPKFENVFVSNSYAYRPEKGHTRAIKFARHCCHYAKNSVILRLDIDNYFDNIDHEILFKRVRAVISDEEVVRLIELCVKMGVVSRRLQWEETTKGVPQGAVLSPILANFYLHPFDQFVLTRTKHYVRYADDFIICFEDKIQAQKMLEEGSVFLQERLKLQLNEPLISEIKDGFEFLGIRIDDKTLSISEQKNNELCQKIQTLDWSGKRFADIGLKHLQGIKNYYAVLLPEGYLAHFDEVLLARIKQLITLKWKDIPNKTVLLDALKSIEFFADKNVLRKAEVRSAIVAHYLAERSQQIHAANETHNEKLIKQRKKEYRRKENEATELVINTYGTYIGVNNKGIKLKTFSKQQVMPPTNNLSHITVLSNGVSISSNAVVYCMDKKIPVDFFSNSGQHTASILSPSFMQTTLWQKQATLAVGQRAEIAKRIIMGKLKNQINLVKYFHKYHKASSEALCRKYDDVLPKMQQLVKLVTAYEVSETDYRPVIMQWEASGALLYWGYVRELISDDEVGFAYRERKGATDLVNCLLNYGYAILYARVWQALLACKLNPMDSVLHVPQSGKPTFVYDVVELFRAQAVDRVVISLIQKGESLDVNKGLLTASTKNLLAQNVIERLNRYEMYRSKELRLCDIIRLQAKAIADYIVDGKAFRPYIAKW